ncbi:ReoY family proteolytic degradation factor [Tuberibacillus calidus]|uniref:ReoY family proteolytic degradation factor n=1 Tax=Tuberibacillus calidus TaxID=340097 RepID=UPI000409F083|nr:ReoY family proteolytic degradation factor [Tuberibacillus calidus]
MEQTISIEDKRAFLKWFLRHYQLKNRECVWLLNYILSDNQLINILRFVDTITDCPRAMMISEKRSQASPFMYRKGTVETDQPEKAFHDLRLDTVEPIYVKLIFPDSSRSSEYVCVLEDNPYALKQLQQTYHQIADRILHEAMRDFQIQKLYEAIDQALDRRDEVAFYQLVAKWRDISQQ